MTRHLRRGFVEVLGITAISLLALGAWRLAAGHGTAGLLAAAPWILAVASVGVSKLHVARHVRATDWGWRALAVAGAIGALATGGPPHGLVGLAGVGGMLGYQTWYSRQHRPASVLAVGRPLPDFPLTRADGTATTSGELRAAPHVVLFYRGSWCPFCVAQVRTLAEQYRELHRRGVRVALVSPQPAEETRSLAARFDVPMDFYVDEHGAAAGLLDIVQSGGVPVAFTAGTNGDTVVPTVVITDGEGRVVWLHHADDHRVRPEPITYLEVIDRAGVGAG